MKLRVRTSLSCGLPYTILLPCLWYLVWRYTILLSCLWYLVGRYTIFLPCLWYLVGRYTIFLPCLWYLVERYTILLPCLWYLVERYTILLPCLWYLVERYTILLPCLWYLVGRYAILLPCLCSIWYLYVYSQSNLGSFRLSHLLHVALKNEKLVKMEFKWIPVFPFILHALYCHIPGNLRLTVLKDCHY